MEKKYKRKSKKIICDCCGNTFEKAISEIKRTEKNNGKHYCSLTCSGTKNINNLGEYKGNVENFRKKTKGKRDKYTGFRDFIRRARQRNKLGNLTLDDLLVQWDLQKGYCPYTGIKLKLPKYNRKYEKLFELASLDRIDSNKLYEKGNVMFVSTPINYMKNSMTKNETIEYCKIITSFWNDNTNKGTNKT